MRTYSTVQEWWNEGEKLFGYDMENWKFICPKCGRINTGKEFVGLTDNWKNIMYQHCIGRYDKTKGCDWSANGFLPMDCDTVIYEGRKVHVFHFANDKEESAKINHYKLKKGVTIDKILEEAKSKRINSSKHCSYVNKDAEYVLFKSLFKDISINIAFPKDLSKWDDFDYVLVLDDSFCQPYTPFYGGSTIPFALTVIDRYNKFMDSLNFLERKREDE